MCFAIKGFAVSLSISTLPSTVRAVEIFRPARAPAVILCRNAPPTLAELTNKMPDGFFRVVHSMPQTVLIVRQFLR